MLFHDMLIVNQEKKIGLTKLIFELIALKAEIKGFWTGHSDAMLTLMEQMLSLVLSNDWAFVL